MATRHTREDVEEGSGPPGANERKVPEADCRRSGDRNEYGLTLVCRGSRAGEKSLCGKRKSPARSRRGAPRAPGKMIFSARSVTYEKRLLPSSRIRRRPFSLYRAPPRTMGSTHYVPSSRGLQRRLLQLARVGLPRQGSRKMAQSPNGLQVSITSIKDATGVHAFISNCGMKAFTLAVNRSSGS
jgi:hypothetical protein